MNISKEKLKELLVRPDHVSAENFKSAEKEAKNKKRDLQDILLEKDLIKDEQLGKLIAEDAGFKLVSLKNTKIEEEVLNLIPELVARSKGIIAFGKEGDAIKVGMMNPDDLETRHLVEKRVGGKVMPYFITKRDVTGALDRYKGSLKQEFEKLFEKLKDVSLAREERDELTVKMVDILMQYGHQNKASDIHVEPYEKKIVVRFRIDGVMHDVLELPKELSDLILTRIKILAKMRTDEHRAAQDGKFRFAINEEQVDVRVSIVPVIEGENVVMRILSSKSRQFSLSDLGLSDNALKKVKNAIKHPHGMILVTGPTGSGKTTTVYAVLKILNKREVHISTIEDPVEYDIEGISQIQVNTKTNLTFAKGLRAIVRQDPDIILVGEIRDEETSGIAINSAMTGHLVLSTLHANDAATTLPRLLDMGIEPFLIASTINVVIAQRLVRKTCASCRVSYQPTSDDIKMIESDAIIKNAFIRLGHKNIKKALIFKGKGCKTCGNTGYIGRIGIFEVLVMAENIKDLIIKRASSDEIMKIAKKNNMTTMLEDGVEKVLNGATTLEEVLRVIRE
ncbi:GspE/PulE family protein [Patescibacteria group bacterium]